MINIQRGTSQGQIQGGRLGGQQPPSLESFKLETKQGNKTITEATLSLIVPISSFRSAPAPLQKILDPPLQEQVE